MAVISDSFSCFYDSKSLGFVLNFVFGGFILLHPPVNAKRTEFATAGRQPSLNLPNRTTAIDFSTIKPSKNIFWFIDHKSIV